MLLQLATSVNDKLFREIHGFSNKQMLVCLVLINCVDLSLDVRDDDAFITSE